MGHCPGTGQEQRIRMIQQISVQDTVMKGVIPQTSHGPSLAPSAEEVFSSVSQA